MSDAELEARMNKIRADFVEALSNPDHPDHDEVMSYRPAYFGDQGYPDLPGGSWESANRPARGPYDAANSTSGA